MEHPVFERDPSEKSETERREVPPLLKLALELGPLLVFFFANARGEMLIERFPILGSIGAPIFLATALFMAATVIALAISWSMTRTLPIMPLVSGIVVLVFGALTLWLHNDTFIKMKPTIVNTLFGGILLGGFSSANPCSAMCSIPLSGSMPRAGGNRRCAGACSSSFWPL